MTVTIRKTLRAPNNSEEVIEMVMEFPDGSSVNLSDLWRIIKEFSPFDVIVGGSAS